MNILIINPNSSQAMTQGMENAIKSITMDEVRATRLLRHTDKVFLD